MATCDLDKFLADINPACPLNFDTTDPGESHACAAAIVSASGRHGAQCLVTPVFPHGPPIAAYVCRDRGIMDAPGARSLCVQVGWPVPAPVVEPTPGSVAGPEAPQWGTGLTLGALGLVTLAGARPLKRLMFDKRPNVVDDRTVSAEPSVDELVETVNRYAKNRVQQNTHTYESDNRYSRIHGFWDLVDERERHLQAIYDASQSLQMNPHSATQLHNLREQHNATLRAGAERLLSAEMLQKAKTAVHGTSALGGSAVELE